MRGCRSFMCVCLAPFENALRCCFLFRTFMCTTEWNSVMLRNHVTRDICMGSCSLTLKISFLYFPPLSISHLLPSLMTLCPRQQISPLFWYYSFAIATILYKRSHRVCGPLRLTLSFRLFFSWFDHPVHDLGSRWGLSHTKERQCTYCSFLSLTHLIFLV